MSTPPDEMPPRPPAFLPTLGPPPDDPRGRLDPYAVEDRQAQERTNAPGILLILAGVINLLAALALIAGGLVFQSFPADKIEEELHKQNPKQLQEINDQLRKAGTTLEEVLWYTGVTLVVMGAIGVLPPLLTIAAGVQMRRLRTYGLCVTGSVLTFLQCGVQTLCCGLPTLSGAFVCGLGVVAFVGGLTAGLWSLIILLSPEVRTAFR